jgi:outer membrane protein TolC
MASRRLLSISVCLLASASAAAAQEPLTVADATARALAKNHAIRIERESVAAADARMSGARGDYDPQICIDLSAGRRRDPNTSLFSGAPAGDVAPTTTSIGSTASISKLFASGATASLWASASREGTNSQLNLFQPAYLTSLGVDLRQPLLRNRAIDPARAALHVTALDRERSGAALDRVLQQTVSEVEAAYWSLVAAQREIDVRRGSVALAEQLRAETEVRIAAGTAPASDLAQPVAELERRQGDLFAAQEASARAERALKQLMLDAPLDPLWDVPLRPTDSPDTAAITVDVASTIAAALRQRPEIRESSARIAQQDIGVQLAEDVLKPRLDLVGGYAMRGLAGDRNETALSLGSLSTAIPASLSGGQASAWRTLSEQKFHDASIGVSLEIPIGAHAARGQLGEAQAGRRQAALTLSQTEEAIAVDVRNAATALQTASSRIQAARAGLAAAETQLRAEQDRFGVGLTTSFFVLTRQNDLAVAQLAEIAALTDYRKAGTELARAAGSLLSDRGIHQE